MKKIWFYAKVGLKDLVGDVATTFVFLVVYTLGMIPLVFVDGLAVLKFIWAVVLAVGLLPLRGFVLNKLWRWR